jgi:hypothetical protein
MRGIENDNERDPGRQITYQVIPDFLAGAQITVAVGGNTVLQMNILRDEDGQLQTKTVTKKFRGKLKGRRLVVPGEN